MKKSFTLSGIFAFLFFLMLILVKTVDVGEIGPAGTSIGLSTINAAVHEMFGVNMALYKITDIMGIGSIAFGLIFAALGFYQLVTRKNLFKVDGEILALGCVDILLGIIYALFMVVTVNRRPILMEGETFPESSFPSSHTLLLFVIFGTSIIIFEKYIRNPKTRKILRLVFLFLILFSVVARLISGVHWFTDIIASVFLSLSMIFAYDGAFKFCKKNKKGKIHG